MYEHTFEGCNARPLASYLKSVGVFRIVALQKDTEAKAWWEFSALRLRTLLSRDELEHFFCEDYSPTPIVSPWNGASGFYPTTKCGGMDLLLDSKASRFSSYRDVIASIKSWPIMQTSFEIIGDVERFLLDAAEGMREGKKKDEVATLVKELRNLAPSAVILREELGTDDYSSIEVNTLERLAKKRGQQKASPIRVWTKAVKKARTLCLRLQRSLDKNSLLLYSRANLPDVSLPWLDAVCAISNDETFYNPVLGTGGNELKLDLSNNFMNCVADLFLKGDAGRTRSLLMAALWNETVSGLVDGKIGQYDPGRAGGYNQGMEVETKEFKINPWDFVFMLEGTLVLASAISRRNLADTRTSLTAPFTVHFSPVGFSSSDYQEAGHKETWLPIWNNPALYSELQHLFGEGRSTLGRRMARDGIDFARAVGNLGVDRGIDSFERYAFLARRGQSYVALPAGRFAVKYRKDVELLDEMDPLLSSVDFFLREFKSVPATLQDARRQIAEAVFSCSRQPETYHFKELIRALGRLARIVALRDRSKKPSLSRPLFGLSPRWIDKCDDGTPEVRIAASLASIRATGGVGTLSSNMADVSPSAPWKWTDRTSQRAWYGNSLAERLGMVVARRLLDGERYSVPVPPFDAVLPLSAHDFMPFLLGQCDEGLLEDLLWGFILINWRKPGLRRIKQRWFHPLHWYPLSRTWCLLKTLHTPGEIQGVKIRREPRIAHLLQAGRGPEACETAIRRLRVSGLCPFEVKYEENLEPSRLAASLMMPVRNHGALQTLVLEIQDTNS